MYDLYIARGQRDDGRPHVELTTLLQLLPGYTVIRGPFELRTEAQRALAEERLQLQEAEEH